MADVCGYPLGHRDRHTCSCTCRLDPGHRNGHLCEVEKRRRGSRVCRHCQRRFTPTNARGPLPDFCSARCRMAYNHDAKTGRGKLVQVGWRNERSGAFHPRKTDSGGDRGPGWFPVYAYTGDIEAARERVGKRRHPEAQRERNPDSEPG